jgi:hypothetical protein
VMAGLGRHTIKQFGTEWNRPLPPSPARTHSTVSPALAPGNWEPEFPRHGHPAAGEAAWFNPSGFSHGTNPAILLCMIILTVIGIWCAVSVVLVLALAGAAARPLPLPEPAGQLQLELCSTPELRPMTASEVQSAAA